MSSTFPISPRTFPPFWYGTYSGLWIYYRIDWALAQQMLAKFTQGSGGEATFTAYSFTDQSYKNGAEPFALVVLNFMAYGAQSGSNDPRAYQELLTPLTYPLNMNDPPPGFGVESASETELSIIAYPTARAAQRPQEGFTAEDFIAGNDHTKTLGPFRLFVPCDDRVAVFWGTLLFGENKFMTWPFVYTIPSPNNLTDPGGMVPATGWDFTIPGSIEEPKHSYDPVTRVCSPSILQVSIDVSGLEARLGNASEILDYSMWTDETGERRPIGSRRNMFGAFSTCLLTGQSPQPKYSYALGNSSHAMVGVLRELLGASPSPWAVQVFQTPPVIAESGTFYAD